MNDYILTQNIPYMSQGIDIIFIDKI